jgi:hypothetical protein
LLGKPPGLGNPAIWGLDYNGNILAVGKALIEIGWLSGPFADPTNRPNDVRFHKCAAFAFTATNLGHALMVKAD